MSNTPSVKLKLKPLPPPKPKAAQASVHPLVACMNILMSMGESGKVVWANSQNRAYYPTPEDRLTYLRRAIGYMRKQATQTNYKWREIPVDPITFIDSDLMLNMGEEIYPKIKDEIFAMLDGTYTEAVLTGGIGVGKTTIALVGTAYGIYYLSCMVSPQREFGIAASSEIIFIFQSLKKELSKAVDYDRFKFMIDNSVYFQEHFKYDKNLEAELRFPFRIIVKPLSGDASAAIGQNVFGGVIDEINFMVVIENSKMAGPDGGTFDQAKKIYESIVRRRESRFMKQGRLPGMLFLVSSKQYPGEFTDRKMMEARTELLEKGRTTIFIYDKRVWEVKPESDFTDEWFWVFAGDGNRQPRILEEGEERAFPEDDAALLVRVPMEYFKPFDNELLDSLRDIAGMSTSALHPFIIKVEALVKAFGSSPSILSRPDVDFNDTKLHIYPRRIVRPQAPRLAHIDLAYSGDSCGVSMGHVAGFKMVARGTALETLPIIHLDFVLEIRPPRNGEIEFENIRRLLYAIRDLGVPLKWVTLDDFQSKDSMQILSQRGFQCGYQSVDLKTTPYDVTKQAFYDERIMAPEHSKALQEFTRLERNMVKNKIDHPPNGSKDCSDAIAGVVYGLTMRRAIWVMHGIPTRNIPQSLLNSENMTKNSISYIEKVKKEKYN